MIKKGVYRHFKGGLYLLEDIAKDSETLDEIVVYRALYNDFSLWVRPLKMWEETVKKDNTNVKRFEFLCDVFEEKNIIKCHMGDIDKNRAMYFIKRLADEC